MRLFILFILVISGLIVGMAIIALIAVAYGLGIMGLTDANAMANLPANPMRLIIMVNHLTMFMIPAIAWGIIWYKKEWLKGLSLKKIPKWLYLIVGLVFLLAAYPIVSKSYEINRLWDLPEWMSTAEDQTAELLKKLLTMDNPGSLILNLLVIAIIPGIGEELIFRGIIQKEFERHLKNPYVAVILGAIVFSALHFQFAGFLPRMFLGIILGLLFYWTGSLWVSMFVHAFNNGMQVVLAYFYPAMIDQDLESSVSSTWYMVLISVLVSMAIGYWFIHQKSKENHIDNDPDNIQIQTV
ncbi:MAG: type II CAAX endopeptidase family protein [Saprospiraceae bacterium]